MDLLKDFSESSVSLPNTEANGIAKVYFVIAKIRFDVGIVFEELFLLGNLHYTFKNVAGSRIAKIIRWHCQSFVVKSVGIVCIQSIRQRQC